MGGDLARGALSRAAPYHRMGRSRVRGTRARGPRDNGVHCRYPRRVVASLHKLHGAPEKPRGAREIGGRRWRS